MDLRSRAPPAYGGYEMTRRQQGFTVLEVLVTLAIFVMIGVYLVAGYLNAMRAYQLAAEQDHREGAIQFARIQLLSEPDRDKLEAGGTFEDNGLQVRWEADVQATAVPSVYSVNFRCDFSGAGQENSKFEESLQLLRPTWVRPEDAQSAQARLKERIKEHVDDLRADRTL